MLVEVEGQGGGTAEAQGGPGPAHVQVSSQQLTVHTVTHRSVSTKPPGPWLVAALRMYPAPGAVWHLQCVAPVRSEQRA